MSYRTGWHYHKVKGGYKGGHNKLQHRVSPTLSTLLVVNLSKPAYLGNRAKYSSSTSSLTDCPFMDFATGAHQPPFSSLLGPAARSNCHLFFPHKTLSGEHGKSQIRPISRFTLFSVHDNCSFHYNVCLQMLPPFPGDSTQYCLKGYIIKSTYLQLKTNKRG